MADDYSGDQFVALDGDIFGGRSMPGSQDSNTRPLSTNIEHRLDGNLRYLLSRGQEVTYNFYSIRNDVGRQFASLGRRYLLSVPWVFYPTIESLTMKAWGSIGHPDSTTGKVELSLEVYLPETSTSLKEATTFTEQSAQNVRTLSTSDISDLPIDHPTVGYILVGLGAKTTSSAGESDNIDRLNQSYRMTDDGSGDTPVASADAQTYFANMGGRSVTIYNQALGDAGNEISGVDYNFDPSNSVNLRNISFFDAKAISFRTEHTTSPERGSIVDRRPETMRAQRQVVGQDVSLHGSNLDRIWRRPRVLATGPPGQDEGQDWPANANRRWQWLNLGSISDPNEELMDSQTGWLADSGQTIACHALVAFFRELESPRGEPGAYYTRPDSKGSLEGSTSVGDAEFEIEIDQMSGGDVSWSDATRIGRSVETKSDITVLPNTKVEWSDLLNTWYWSRHPRGFGDTTPTGGVYRYAFREGMIKAKDKADWALLTPIRIDTDLSGADLSTPVRMQLRFNQWSVLPDDPSDRKVTVGYNLIVLNTLWTSRTTP